MQALVSDEKEFIKNDKVKIDHKKWFYCTLASKFVKWLWTVRIDLSPTTRPEAFSRPSYLSGHSVDEFSREMLAVLCKLHYNNEIS